MADDSRETPAAFSPEEADQIRQMFKTPGLNRFPCPRCGADLHSGAPMSGGSMALVWELRCTRCQRSVIFSERSEGPPPA